MGKKKDGGGDDRLTIDKLLAMTEEEREETLPGIYAMMDAYIQFLSVSDRRIAVLRKIGPLPESFSAERLATIESLCALCWSTGLMPKDVAHGYFKAYISKVRGEAAENEIREAIMERIGSAIGSTEEETTQNLRDILTDIGVDPEAVDVFIHQMEQGGTASVPIPGSGVEAATGPRRKPEV